MLAMLFANNRLFAQQWCGTADPETLLFVPNNFQNRNSNDPVCIKVKFHIVRQTNGTGGFNSANINNILNRINGDFNNHNIFFKSVGIDYIDSNVYYDLPATEVDNLMLENHTDTAFNFYIVNSAPFGGRSISNTEFIVLASEASNSISSHEIGHSLELYHTFLGYNTGGSTQERIERSGVNANCDNAGDLLCDTPADPYVAYYDVDSNCNYLGSETYFGLPYDPDTHNIMSYSSPSCLNSFTQGQEDRMHYFIQTLPALQNIVSSTCEIPDIMGNSAICNGNQETYTISNTTVGANWFVSSNLVKVSFTANSVTIKPVVNAAGQATITANISGYLVEENITIASAPQITNHTIRGGADNVTFNSFMPLRYKMLQQIANIIGQLFLIVIVVMIQVQKLRVQQEIH